MPLGLGHLEKDGKIIETIWVNKLIETATKDPIFPIAIPAPSGLRVRVTSGAITSIDALLFTVTDFDTIGATARLDHGAIP
jgi:hypothetical protein